MKVKELITELLNKNMDAEVELEVNVDYQCGEYKYATGIAMNVEVDEGGKKVYITTEE